MSSIRSAPGFMNIYELIYILGNGLSAPAITKIDKAKVNNSEFHTAGFSGNITDDYNVYSIFDVVYPNSLEYLIEKKQYPLHLKLLHLKVAIRHDQRYQLLKMDTATKIYNDEYSFMQDSLVFMVMQQCRSFLSGKQLKSYVLSDYAYHELPAEFWSYDIHWYRLLVDRAACGDLPSIGKFYGSVYFKEEDVKRCVSGQPAAQSPPTKSSSLINLETYTTPWLQTLSAIYEEYGKEKLAHVSKISVEYFITGYIKKHNLDISQSDVPFLAKFIRLAEQKDGKKYHANLKHKKG